MPRSSVPAARILQWFRRRPTYLPRGSWSLAVAVAYRSVYYLTLGPLRASCCAFLPYLVAVKVPHPHSIANRLPDSTTSHSTDSFDLRLSHEVDWCTFSLIFLCGIISRTVGFVLPSFPRHWSIHGMVVQTPGTAPSRAILDWPGRLMSSKLDC